MRKQLLNIIMWGVTSFLWVSFCYSQDTPEEIDTLRSVAPNVFIDCYDCDYDYVRTEITFVNFVRDRKQADVHILVTEQRTGSGGTEYTAEFIGQGEYEDMRDTLKYLSTESDTDDIIRAGLAHILKMGLVRYVAKTPLAEHLSIQYTQPSEPTAVVDKWNYWVFEIEANCWFSGEESYHDLNFWGNLSASRVTEQSKIYLGIWGNYNEEKFDYDYLKQLSINRSKGFNASYTLSLNDHWSANIYGEVYTSTYSNKKLQTYNASAVEYNLFPYDQSTQRQLRFQYRIAVVYVDYEEETIYNKTEEWLTSGKIGIFLDLIRPWGSVNTSLYASHYFHDFEKNRCTVYSRLSYRLFEGFSLNFNGRISRIYDQLALPKGDITDETLLLRTQEMATSYDYWTSVGVSYSFGSIYNNIVNPRFGN